MIAFMRLKTIPLYLLKNTLGTSFKFHSNFSFKMSNLKKLLPFCKQMLISWSHYLSTSPEAPSQILSQFLQYNNYNETEGAVIHFENSLIKYILTSHCSYFKMAGSYHGSISRMNIN